MRDPFNEVRTIPGIRRIFAQMFEQLTDVRFAFLETIADDRGAVLIWDVTFRFRPYRAGERERIHGASHLRFDQQGRIVHHWDYWDAADELYAKLPVIGPVMRWWRKRLA